MAKDGAIISIFILGISFYFALPSQANIGYMIVEVLAEGLPKSTVIASKALFSFLSLLIFGSSINYIISQVKKGNF